MARSLDQVRIGSFTPVAPVVLAPMAGVTNAPFRSLCRQFAPGLLYVNEMVMATAVVHGNSKTERMMTFGADEQPRSLQIYGSDPVILGEAIRMLCESDRVDHIDINFGCPAAKVTRKGGGAAVLPSPTCCGPSCAALSPRHHRSKCRSRSSSARACSSRC